MNSLYWELSKLLAYRGGHLIRLLFNLLTDGLHTVGVRA